MAGLPATQTDPMAEFQAKLKERVRDDIRDLLPEDAVAGLVQKAVEEEFFKPRITKHDYGRTEEKPSWFVEEVVKAAKPIIESAVKQCIADHPEGVEKVIKDFLGANQLAVATTSALTGILGSMVMSLQDEFRNRR